MLKCSFRIEIGGNDVTSRWNKTLESISVTRAARETSDTCDIQLADPDGSTVMPKTGDDIVISLGHSEDDIGQVFEGYVDGVRSKGDKNSGRKISISGSSVDNKSKVKAAGLRTAENMTFKEVAQEWGKKSDLDEVIVAGGLADEKRVFWIMQHESFQSWGRRTAREIGASFKIIRKRGFFAPLNEGISATGKALTTIVAEWGANLLSWDVTPVIGRPQYGKAVGRHYDLVKAKWIEVEASISGAEVDVEFRSALGSANEENATQKTKSDGKDSEREKGGGTVSIIGDYAAEPEAPLSLRGARDGADGTYTIDSLTHTANESGFVTDNQVRLPKDGAGKDTR